MESIVQNESDELLRLFLEEAREYLDGIENDLLALEEQGNEVDPELVNKVFRAVHSIKGSAGCLNFTKIADLAHAMETVLVFFREGKSFPTPRIIDTLLASFDLLSCLLDRIHEEDPFDISGQLAELSELIREVNPPESQEAPVDEPAGNLLGEILIQAGVIERQDIDNALAEQKKIGEILLDQEKVTPTQLNEALAKQKANGQNSIRVDCSKLDQLLNTIGEVVISQAHVLQMSRDLEEGSFAEEMLAVLDRLERNTRSLQGQIMNICMIPIGPMLHQYHRVVRDLGIAQGKKIELVIRGEETEIDKTIVEKLNDPLKHMIRNSIDHGLESIAERLSQGKEEAGTITLSAYQEGGSIVIEVADDGKGLDKEAIIAKAKKLGLVGKEELGDEQVHSLIFRPGFSTSESVTDLSGRGVGMDVVKRNIEALRGQIQISTECNVGTTFRLRLPLTMAIVDGVLVHIAQSHFVLPIAQVEECVELTPENVEEAHGRYYFSLRGKLIPYIRLREYFDIEGEPPFIEQIVIVGVEGERIGLVVDEVIGDVQTVIKPLGIGRIKAENFSGATIMGNGDVAFILDVLNVVRRAQDSERSSIPRGNNR